MALRESPYGYSSRPNPHPPGPPSYPYPAPNEHNTPNRPALPPMSSLLSPQNEQHYQPHQQPSFPPQPQPQRNEPNHHNQQHPLWHSEQHPEAPPHHIYQPSQPSNAHAAQYQGRPMLLPNSQGVATQRRDEQAAKEYDEGQRSASVVEANYKWKNKTYPPERPDIKRQDSMQSESSSSRQSQGAGSMSISGYLSGEVSPTIDRTPPPTYTIRMRQEPMAARACGFGERDRRVIDPPPILQMTVDSPSSTPEQISAMIRNPYTVVHCVLWDPSTNKDDSAMPTTADKRQQRRLMGTLVSSPFVGQDEHNVEGCFFTFPDLSVRTPGTYTLKFSLVIIEPTNMREGVKEPIRSVTFSSPFTVYNAKDFCGMRASTALTKKLKHQGCLISVKKGNAKSNREDDDDDDDDDEEDDKRGKRAKH